jgi:hypothetical protein
MSVWPIRYNFDISIKICIAILLFGLALLGGYPSFFSSNAKLSAPTATLKMSITPSIPIQGGNRYLDGIIM